MQKYVKIYMNFFGYDIGDFIPCEVSGSTAVEVHHIDGRGKGMDVIENLMGVSRNTHNDCGALKISREKQHEIHNAFMKKYGVKKTI